jgi:parallel beta-helix repeat protein
MARRLARSIGPLGLRALWIAGALASGCGPDLCAGVTGSCLPIPTGSTEQTIGTTLATAAPGTTVVFGSGTFRFTNTLSCTSSSTDLTLRGQGQTQTILDWTGQLAGAQGIFCNANGFTLTDLTVANTTGDGVKVESADRVTFKRVTVRWDAADYSTHGAYGLYPVQTSNVLITDSTVLGASDAGIYVGQSNKIVVMNNTARDNVAGIEIENSTDADVIDNDAEDNTAGVLVFALPELQRKTTRGVRLLNNRMLHNNGANFAKPGTIVQKVPAGIGVLIMAASEVELFSNTISDNGSTGIGVVSYFVAETPTTDTQYYPFSTKVWIRENTFSGNGTAPDATSRIGAGLASSFTMGPIPTLLWDGIADPALVAANAQNPQTLCISGVAPSFANLHADAPNVPPFPFTTDATPFSCTLAPLPAVTVAQGL